MKHIKTYEGLFSFLKKKKPVEPIKPIIEGDVLYEPITVPEMIKYDGTETFPFSQLEIDYINGLSEHVEYRTGKNYINDHYFIKIMNKHPIEFYLRKHNDEWYIVTIKDHKIGDYDQYRYYKCDTFDGFKQLFNQIT